jgi:large subunit ribosomal protein L25
MEDIVIEAKKRDVIGKQVKTLRREGWVPAVIYGQGIVPIAISLDAKFANRVLPGITSSQFVTVDVEGEQFTTLVRDRQKHVIRNYLLHVDFMSVSMTEKLHTSVPIVLLGEAPAVSEGGILVTGQEYLDVQSLPKDLPERVSIEISTLLEIGDAIYVRDLEMPEAVEVLTDADEMVVLVTAPAAIEEEEVEVEEEELFLDEDAEPEVIERGKKEEEDEEDIE